jgi:hypothetical protein
VGEGLIKNGRLRRSRPRYLPLRNLGAWVTRALGPPHGILAVHSRDTYRAAEIFTSKEPRDDDTYDEARVPHGPSLPFLVILLAWLRDKAKKRYITLRFPPSQPKAGY